MAAMRARTQLRGEAERSLVRRCEEQIARCLAYEAKVAKRRRALRQAVSMLRRGRSEQLVLAQLAERVPEAVSIVGQEQRDEDWLRRQLDGLDSPPAS